MWWIVVPGAAALAYKIYERLREREEVAREDGDAGKGADREVPALGPRLRRWVGILRGAPPPEEAAPAPAPPPRARRPARFRPSHLTLLTALAVVALTVLRRGVDATWLAWAQPILLGALIGIGTNWIAIRMLFRPQRRVLGVIQGVIPANRERIAAQIAHGVASQLLDRETIRRAVHESDLVRKQIDAFVTGLGRLVRDPEFRGDVEELLVGWVGALVEDEAFRRRLVAGLGRVARRAPERLGGVLGAFSGDIGRWLEDLVHRHQDAILAGLNDQVPAMVAELSDRLVVWLDALPSRVETRRLAIEQAITEAVARRVSAFDVEGLVRRRLDTFSTADLEALILSATEEQLAWLQFLGWFIGAAAVPVLAGIEALVRLF